MAPSCEAPRPGFVEIEVYPVKGIPLAFWNRRNRTVPPLLRSRTVSYVPAARSSFRHGHHRSRPRRSQATGTTEAPRYYGARPDHRRLGRRPQRHRHIFPGGRAVRLRHGVDAAVHLSADVRDPADQRTYWPGHRPGPRRKHAAPLSGITALPAGRPACGRQYHQYRR